MSGATPLFPCADTPELNATFTLRKVWLKSELRIYTLNCTGCPRSYGHYFGISFQSWFWVKNVIYIWVQFTTVRDLWVF